MLVINKEELKSLAVVSTRHLAVRFSQRAERDLLDFASAEEVAFQVASAEWGYYHGSDNKLVLVVEYEGFQFGLGVRVNGNDIVVTTFVNEDQVGFALDSEFKTFFL